MLRAWPRILTFASPVLLAAMGFLLAVVVDSPLPEGPRFRAGAALLFVYGSQRADLRERYRAAAESWADGLARFRGVRPKVVADSDLTCEDRREATLVLLGRPELNSAVREVVDRLPVRFLPDGFVFGGREYRKSDHVLRVAVASPWHPERMLLVIAGATPDAPLGALSFGFGRQDYAVAEGGRVLRYGRLRQGRFDPATDVDLEREREGFRAGGGLVTTPHVEIYFPRPGINPVKVQRQAGDIEERLARARRNLGREVELCVRYQLYPSVEVKGRLSDSVALAHRDGDSRTVHAVFAEEENGIEEALELGFLVDEALGHSAMPHLARGLERVLSGSDGLLVASRLVHQGFEPDLDQVEALPEAIYEPFAASWVSFLRERLGREGFLALYGGERAVDLSGLSRQWRSGLALEARANEARFAAEAAASRAAYRLPGLQKGFNYAYSNDRESGYATERSQRSLAALAKLGANAIALVPYGFSSPSRLTEIRRAGKSLFTESDQSLRVAVRQARSLGLTVLLKPQIWVSADVWPSDIDFAAEGDWERWFRSYEDWILPYALAAEELRVDLFCVGTELTQAALEYPDRFRKLIARIRRIYRGPLTYAANWHQEFEQVSFWDTLDLIGLNNYYPLAQSPLADEKALAMGAAEIASRVEAVAEREGKRVVFTEVGFPSLGSAGLSASAGEKLEREPGLARQALLYRITFETYWSRPWFAGLYWWKWFSDPANAGPGGDPWTPRGKPAEAVVSRWFHRAAVPPR